MLLFLAIRLSSRDYMTPSDRKSRLGIGLFLQIEIILSKLLPLRLLVCLDARHFVTYFLTIIREKFGGDNVEWLENQISEFYSLSDQLENGVIGIEFEIF